MIGNDVTSENWEEKNKTKTKQNKKTASIPDIIVFS
jgi:hypothetical protein